MKTSTRLSALALAASLAVSVMAPGIAMASQKSKNQWRNIGIGAAAVGAYGLLKGDKALTAIGAAGAGYSAYRYEQDPITKARKARHAARITGRQVRVSTTRTTDTGTT